MRKTNASMTNSLLLLCNLQTLGFARLAFTLARTNAERSQFPEASGVNSTADHIFDPVLPHPQHESSAR